MLNITELRLIEKPKEEPSFTADELGREIGNQANELVEMARTWASRTEPVSFKEFEQALRLAMFALARLVVMLFLSLREQQVMGERDWTRERGGRRFKLAPSQARSLTTIFGVVRYMRRYVREIAQEVRRGFYPLDVSLGLCADRFSWNVLSIAARLATKLSFAEARTTLSTFVPNAPSTEVIEKTVLGFGHHTADFFEQAPAPEGDGDVLVIMIDSKGAPTATDSELSRRRGKRRTRRLPSSPRHRGRARRRRYPNKPRRKKGDKSKNAKMATMVVMYTLRRCGPNLLGPINRWQYASFAPKRHAFEIARREADKRGFTESSGKVIQLVTDGDDDLAVYAGSFFPEARHDLDAIHAIEKLWKAGACLYREGSAELKKWIEIQKRRLYSGKVTKIIKDLRQHLLDTPKTGPGNKGRRERLGAVLRYLEKRVHMMRYDEIIDADLELGTGAVEGAVKNIIGKRFDHGGMRWIKERAEALLQLRCIEANGQWEAFIDFVHDRLRAEAIADGTRPRLQSTTPAALPALREAA